MAYEPTNWKAGDTVTSAKLNKLEQGVAGAGVLVVSMDDETGALDKTWQEIHDAGFAVVKHDINHNPNITGIGFVAEIALRAGAYELVIWDDGDYILCITDSADGYPVAEDDSSADPDPTPNPSDDEGSDK